MDFNNSREILCEFKIQYRYIIVFFFPIKTILKNFFSTGKNLQFELVCNFSYKWIFFFHCNIKINA